MQPSQQQANDNSLNTRSIIKTLEVVVKHQQNQQKKANCQRVLNKFIEFKNNSLLKQLDQENQKRLVQIRTWLKLYRNAFEKTTQKQAYKQFKIPNGQIAQHLLNLQQRIDPKDYKTSYLRAITIKKKQFNWSKEFIQDWMKAVDQQRTLQQQKNKQKQLQRANQIRNQPLPPSIQSQPQPPIQQSQPIQAPLPDTQSIKLQQKKASTKQIQKSVQKLPGQKPEKKLKKQQGGQKPQKQKRGPKPKKQVDQSQSSDNQQKRQKQIARKKHQKQARENLLKYQKPKQPKNRVKALMQYLTARKDFSSTVSNQHKLKQLAEFLNQNLQKFMKHHLTNLIQIAKLRNRKHQTLASSGNQFTYFSKQGYTSLKPINHLQVSQEPARMLKINYKSKFELYSLLRSRQQLLEEALLKMYASKKQSQTNKTSDKKLWQYLLRPNHVVQKTQQFTQMQQTRTDRLSIQIAHIRYLFQSHKFIRNSWLMMNCYNS